MARVRQKLVDDRRVEILGNKEQVDESCKALGTVGPLPPKEGEARIIIQDLIEKQNLKACILFDGNRVWDSRPIIKNMREIGRKGRLYDGPMPYYEKIGQHVAIPHAEKMLLTDNTYKFLTLCCGSIAHYNMEGWVANYPTLKELREFFEKNEYGQSVEEYLPDWHTDAKKIVDRILLILNVHDAGKSILDTYRSSRTQ